MPMKLIVLGFVWAIGSVLCGCGTRPTDGNFADYLTPQDLNAAPDLYDGKEVLVRGYVMIGTNARSLAQSKHAVKEFARALDKNAPDSVIAKYDNDCLTLLPSGVVMEHRGILDKRTLTFKGVFLKNYNDGTVVDLQACGLNAVILDEEYMEQLFHSLEN